MRSLNKLKLNAPNIFQHIINSVGGTKSHLPIQEVETRKPRDYSYLHGIGTMEGPLSIKDIIKLRNIQQDISDSYISDEIKLKSNDGDHEKRIIDPKLERIEVYKKVLKDLANFSKN